MRSPAHGEMPAAPGQAPGASCLHQDLQEEGRGRPGRNGDPAEEQSVLKPRGNIQG